MKCLETWIGKKKVLIGNMDSIQIDIITLLIKQKNVRK